MADWKTRLAVSFQEGGRTVLITPINAFSSTLSLNAEVLHSIEATHIGVVFTPQTMNFSLTVSAIGDVAAQLTALALEGTRFDIILQETDDGADWSYKKVVMKECIITQSSQSVAISGAPQVTFSGFSLSASAEPKSGQALEIP